MSCIVKSPIWTVRLGPEEVDMSTRLRILHVTKRFHPFLGGVERYVEDLAVAQAELGHSVRILTIDRDLVGGDPRRLPPMTSYRGLEVSAVPAAGTARKQFATGRFAHILGLLRSADVVHQHDPRFLFETAITVRRLVNRPLVLHTHGLIWHTTRYALLKKIAMSWYYGPLLRTMVDAIIADSEADAIRLAEGGRVAGPKVRVIQNAIDLTRFRNIPREPEAGLVVSFGRVDEHKGLDRLLAALPLISGDWRLVIAGTGPLELIARLQKQAVGLGIDRRVVWAGRLTDPALDELLGRASLAVFPSRSEGFGLALLEALAAGVPVFASDILPHREILGPDLKSQVIRFDDYHLVAAAIGDSLHETDLSELARLGRLRSAAFEHRDLVTAIETLYQDLGLLPEPASGISSA